MSDSNMLLDMIHAELKGNESAWRTIMGVEDELKLVVDQYSTTVARDRFSKISKNLNVSVVTEHGRPETASVIIRMQTFASLLVNVVQAAQEHRDSVPFSEVLSKLKPVRGSVRPLRLDTEQELHQLQPIGSR